MGGGSIYAFAEAEAFRASQAKNGNNSNNLGGGGPREYEEEKLDSSSYQ